MTFPGLFAQEGWYSLQFIAARLNRSERTVQHWAKTGLFTRMGLKVICVPAKGSSGRCKTWIFVPVLSKSAMLKHIALDIPQSERVISTSARLISGSGTPSLC